MLVTVSSEAVKPSHSTITFPFLPKPFVNRPYLNPELRPVFLIHFLPSNRNTKFLNHHLSQPIATPSSSISTIHHLILKQQQPCLLLLIARTIMIIPSTSPSRPELPSTAHDNLQQSKSAPNIPTPHFTLKTVLSTGFSPGNWIVTRSGSRNHVLASVLPKRLLPDRGRQTSADRSAFRKRPPDLRGRRRWLGRGGICGNRQRRGGSWGSMGWREGGRDGVGMGRQVCWPLCPDPSLHIHAHHDG
jgi:hypothetical protein